MKKIEKVEKTGIICYTRGKLSKNYSGQLFPIMGIGKVFYWHSESNTCYTADTLVHGLRTLNEAFFHRNPNLLGLGRQFLQINFGKFGVYSADLSASILVQ